MFVNKQEKIAVWLSNDQIGTLLTSIINDIALLDKINTLAEYEVPKLKESKEKYLAIQTILFDALQRV